VFFSFSKFYYELNINNTNSSANAQCSCFSYLELESHTNAYVIVMFIRMSELFFFCFDRCVHLINKKQLTNNQLTSIETQK